MYKRFQVCLIAVFLFMSCGSIYAATSQLWMDSTATTRMGTAALQDQINAAQSAQQTQEQQNQQLQQRALELLTEQQKAMLEDMQKGSQQSSSEGSQFKPLPRTNTEPNNPWLKKNPWGNTQENPYSGQQYKSNTTPAPNNNRGGIYVKPGSGATEDVNQKATPSKPVNIFK